MANIQTILDNLFKNEFSIDNFKIFVGELFNQAPQRGIETVSNVDNLNYKITQLLVNSDLPKHKRIDIVVVEMLNDKKGTLEKARSLQRNIISKHIKYDRNLGLTNILAVFRSKNEINWRLSYVKQDFKVIEENGKKKITDQLSPAKRFSFFVEPKNSRNITVKKNFYKLLDDEIAPSIDDIEKAFSVEAVTSDFFNNYKLNYQRLLALFEQDPSFKTIQATLNNGDEHFSENFVKKLMGQIVFLYFLQKKGWIGVEQNELWGTGSHSYMRDLYNECIQGGDTKKENGGINYFNDYLEHLFYATLNEKRDNHRSEYFNIKIPYLNGGLFEPINGYIWKGDEHMIFQGNEKKANEAFGELLDFFDQYNFTVYENDPLEQDVAVDPEMLGKIFENLLPENERKGKGSFYTPREIVHYMCKESLKQYLITKTGLEESRIDKLMKLKDSMETMKKFEKKETSSEQYQKYIEFEQDANKIDEALANVKIVDPAVGSGAFPMGILKEIVTLRTYIKRNILLNDDPDLQYKLKKEALENCIYGVDIDPGAVDIAKLRFWLSLIIENDSQTIETLPNLDYKIMQGNSLIDQLVIGDSVIDIITDDDIKDSDKVNKKLANVSGIGLFDDQLDSSHLIQKIKFLHKKFFLAKTPEEKKNLKKEIDQIEKSLIRAGCEEEISKIKSQIDNITLKTTVTGAQLTDKELKVVEIYKNTIENIKDLEAKFERDNIRPFFPWKLHFGEIFKEQGGFDIVIGNPPYVNVERIDKTIKDNIKNFKTAYQKYDLYVLFYELGINLLNDNGTLSYITSNKFLSQGYGLLLRQMFLNYNINQIINFNYNVFDSAMVRTCILQLCKEKKMKNTIKIIDVNNKNDKSKFENLEYSILNQSVFESTDENNFRINLTDQKILLLQKIENNTLRLDDICSVNYGLRPSSEKLNLKKEAFISDQNTGILKPYFEGKDMGYWLINKSAYLDYKPDVMYNPMFPELFENEKIVGLRTLSDIGKLRFIYDDAGFYCNDSVVVLVLWYKFENIEYQTIKRLITKEKIEVSKKYSLMFLQGILNSKLIKFYVNELFYDGTHFYPNHMKQLPIKKLILPQADKVVDLVNEIYKDVKFNQNQNENMLSNKLDNLIFHLYELTYDEVLIVDPEFSLSKEEYESFTW